MCGYQEVIAIDGPAASGKSTIAWKLSEELGIPYINTGNMYRALTWYLADEGLSLDPPSEEEISPLLAKLDLEYAVLPGGRYDIMINGEFAGDRIRKPEITARVSAVAALPCVRDWLVAKQRSMLSLGLIVMEGRDIGTVVFPRARYKFFLTASPRVRAMRRLAQGEAPEGATVESVAREIEERDRLDSSRKIAPLRKADDAVLVDGSDMSIDEVVSLIVSKVRGADERH